LASFQARVPKPSLRRFPESLTRPILDNMKPPDSSAWPQPVTVDQHYSPQFYAELWGTSVSTVVRWFQDLEGVLKLSKPSKNGKRTRVELRIPFSVAMRVYRERTRAALE